MGEKIEFSDYMLKFRDDAKKLELFDKKIDKLKKSGLKKKKLLSILNSELENTKTEESFYKNDKDIDRREEIERNIKDILSYKKRLKNLINDIEEGREIENEIIDKSFLETAFSFDKKMFKNIEISFKELSENIVFKKGSDFEKRKFKVSSFIQVGKDNITIVDQKVFDLINGKNGIELVESEKYKLSEKEDSVYIEKVENTNKDDINKVDINKDDKKVEINKKTESEKKEKKLIDNPKELEKKFRAIMGEHKFRYYPIAMELGRELSKQINSIKDFKKLINEIDLQFGEKQLYTNEEIEAKKEKGIYLKDQKDILKIVKEQINLEFIKNSKDITSDLTELEVGDFLEKDSKSRLYQNLLSNDEKLPFDKFTTVLENLDFLEKDSKSRLYQNLLSNYERLSIDKFTAVLENLDTKIDLINLNHFSDEQIKELKPILNNLIDSNLIESSQISYPYKKELIITE